MAKPSKKEIQELRDWLVQVYHKDRLAEQEIDRKYVDDDFKVDYLPEKVHKLRTGKAYRMVSAPAEHIVSSNPKLYREPKGKAVEASKRVAQEGNRWLRLLLRQNPQPLKEHIKKLLGKGEAWIYLSHNDAFMPYDANDMPVTFFAPDPTIVFVDPYGGEKKGIPNRLVVYTKRVAWQVREDYPWWGRQWRPNAAEGQTWNTLIDFMMYFDNNYRYFEAEKEALFYETDKEGKPVFDKSDKLVPYDGEGIQENFYGFVPFVHCYSGFGEGSPDGNPVNLAVSRIRKTRDLIEEYTAIKSILNYTIFEYSIPTLDLQYDPAIGEPSGDIGSEYDRSPGAFNVMGLPAGSKLGRSVEMPPPTEQFAYLGTIERQIDEEDPLGRIAQVTGTSGRQDIRAEEAGLRRYDTIVENSAHAWETAFGLAFKMIEKIPSLKPDALNKNDIGKHYEVQIELKAEDPIANQIRSADGDRKQMNGIIDWETNLIDFQGYTEDKAEKIMDNGVIDKIVLGDPVTLRMIALQNARERGMEQEYLAIEQQMEQGGQGGIGSQGGEPRVGNIKTQRGVEETDMSLAQKPTRRPPIG